jgi:hydroxyacyl-ACP dehydratase HTD2-like protein with hotdog domain
MHRGSFLLLYHQNLVYQSKTHGTSNKSSNDIDVSDIGKNLTDKDVLVLPMDMVLVEEHKVHFQRVIDHFGQVIQSHGILIYIPDII